MTDNYKQQQIATNNDKRQTRINNKQQQMPTNDKHQATKNDNPHHHEIVYFNRAFIF